MSLASARESLDDLVHSPVRFTLLCALNTAGEADYQVLKERMNVSYALLSKHATILEQAGYITVSKQFVGKTPHTFYGLSHAGRQAIRRHLEAIDEIRKGL